MKTWALCSSYKYIVLYRSSLCLRGTIDYCNPHKGHCLLVVPVKIAEHSFGIYTEYFCISIKLIEKESSVIGHWTLSSVDSVFETLLVFILTNISYYCYYFCSL
jgi:hypothetical protein